MLWYKAWLETRARFLACLVGTTIIVGFFVYHAESIIRPEGRSARYTNGLMFYAQGYLMGIWILCVVLLAMGGLMRERAMGTSSFTLALPVSRTRMSGIRIAVGFLQAIALGVVPWAVILSITRFEESPVRFSQAGFYLLLLISGGLIFFAFAILISALIEGEYTAPALTYGLTIFSVLLFGSVGRLRPYADIWRFMGGDNHLNHTTWMLSGPIPWPGVIACVTIAALMLLISIAVIQKREF